VSVLPARRIIPYDPFVNIPIEGEGNEKEENNGEQEQERIIKNSSKKRRISEDYVNMSDIERKNEYPYEDTNTQDYVNIIDQLVDEANKPIVSYVDYEDAVGNQSVASVTSDSANDSDYTIGQPSPVSHHQGLALGDEYVFPKNNANMLQMSGFNKLV
jgi:hypothetical protein